MKIALVDPSLFTWPYDAALALALRELGHEVLIFGKPLAEDSAGPAYPMLRAHFYRAFAHPLAQHLPRGLFLAGKGVSHVGAMWQLLAELRRFEPDVIHVQWAPLPIVDRAFLPALRAIAPLVLTVHDPVPYNGNPRSRLQQLSAVAIMARFDRLIVHTEIAMRRLGQYGLPAARTRRIPHGPMDQRSPTPAAVDPIAAAGRVKILLFGRLKPYKGADLLIEAAAQLPAAVREGCEIAIVGEPFMDLAPLQRRIERAGLQPHVRIEPRHVPEAEVEALLATADVLALPYREIDASGVLMRALAAGVPIIATRIGMFAELLEDGRHGRLLAVDDVSGLARALEELIVDAELRARMGREVRRLRDQVPSWNTIARLTEQLYHELVPAKNSTRQAVANATA